MKMTVRIEAEEKSPIVDGDRGRHLNSVRIVYVLHRLYTEPGRGSAGIRRLYTGCDIGPVETDSTHPVERFGSS